MSAPVPDDTPPDDPPPEGAHAGAPFRTSEPTDERRQEVAREKSWARVEAITERQLEQERARRRRHDRLALGAWVGSGIAAVVSFGLAFAGWTEAGAFACLSISLLACTSGLVLYRRRIARGAVS